MKIKLQREKLFNQLTQTKLLNLITNPIKLSFLYLKQN